MALQVNSSIVQVPASQTAGAACDVRAMEAKTVSVEGTFSATLQVQISCDPSDTPATTSWTNVGTALTAPGNVYVQQPCCWIRINANPFTSNTSAVGRVAGMTSFA